MLQAPVVAIFFDGSAAVQILYPGTERTFQDYVDMVFTSYISSQLQSANQIDIVWDNYIKNSLKAITKEKRRKSVQRRVASATILLSKWKDFLCVDDNKIGFHFQQAIKVPTEDGKSIYAVAVYYAT